MGHDGRVAREQQGPVNGTVVMWNDDEGWGTVASPDVSGEVWAHFSTVAGDGYRSLSAGQSVSFTYETPGQDGFPHRAVSVWRR
jgi:CspA family cold shock protein